MSKENKMGILEVKGVNKRFGGLQALGDVNLDVARRHVHAIIGPNGAGKSTLAELPGRPAEPDTGAVMFDGDTLLGMKPHEINQMGVSRVFQTPEIFGPDGLENVMIPALAKRDGVVQGCNMFQASTRNAEIIEEADHVLPSRPADEKARHHPGIAVARRQAPAGTGHVPGPGAQAAAARRADRRHGARRHQQHHRPAEADQAKRGITKVVIEHDMHVVFSLADRITVLAQGTHHRRRQAEKTSRATRRSRKPIWEGRT
jgi:branched-chain amino acid transport system ATP-binding protein